MKIKELFVLDDIYTDIEVINCETAQDFKRMIEDCKVIPILWENKYVNINSNYIISYII